MPSAVPISDTPHALPAPARREPSSSPRSPSSATYVGWVRHRRFAPIIRSFAFPLYMLYLDLDEIDQVLATGRLWASDRRRRALALGRFLRRDYLGNPSRDLRAEVQDRVQQELGFRPNGPVRLLTHARQYGCLFNPVSFYYCFDRDQASGSESLSAIVAEITNTPWKERHAYVLDCRELPATVPDQSRACSPTRPKRFKFEKVFHVSPFMPMGLAYDWALSVPCPKAGSRLAVHMTLRETDRSESVSCVGTRGTPGRRVFDATLRLDRRAIGPRTLDAMLLRFPFMTARVILSIHMNALWLWLRRVPAYPHPDRRPNASRPVAAGPAGVENESVHAARVELSERFQSSAQERDPMTTMPIAGEQQTITRAPKTLERAGRHVVRAMVHRIRCGQLTIEDAAGILAGGDGNGGPCVSARVTDPAVYRSLLLNGSAGAADSFIRGDWTSDDLAGLFELLLLNRDALDAAQSPLTRIAARLARIANALTRNSRSGSRRNIRAHYDLSNDFFALWLDPTMLYSSAYFERPDMTLEEAQLAKVDRCCTKLDLKPTDRLLEIGTGWGAAAIRAVERFGCRVVTTTISDQQFELASARVRDRGLQDRITVVKLDYRDLEREFGAGSFDKVLSIEMIEAVGHEYLPGFFQTISRMLKPDGMAMIQGIWIRDQRYETARRTVDFLKRHIFTGSCLLGLSAMTRAVRDRTDMAIIHMDDIGPHYVRTLRAWNDAFHARLDAVRSLGYDERFIRKWRYYFEYCEGAFRARHCGDYQILLAKPLARPTIGSAPPL